MIVISQPRGGTLYVRTSYGNFLCHSVCGISFIFYERNKFGIDSKRIDRHAICVFHLISRVNKSMIGTNIKLLVIIPVFSKVSFVSTILEKKKKKLGSIIKRNKN